MQKGHGRMGYRDAMQRVWEEEEDGAEMVFDDDWVERSKKRFAP